MSPHFLSMAARRSSTVAAIGGSVTSGLPFGTFTGDDHANAHWLYHRKLARWLSTQWPRTQHDALNRSFNCGLPAVGPAFTTLCLHALLPAAPNLVLVEYAINVASASDVEWFELLIRKLLLSDPNLAIIVVSSFKLVDADRVEVSSRRFTTECMSEQHICEQSGRTLRHAPGSSSESAIERVCSHYGLPLVSLRRALSDDIGRPPSTIASFMKDCAHPNPQGHSSSRNSSCTHSVVPRRRPVTRTTNRPGHAYSRKRSHCQWRYHRRCWLAIRALHSSEAARVRLPATMAMDSRKPLSPARDSRRSMAASLDYAHTAQGALSGCVSPSAQTDAGRGRMWDTCRAIALRWGRRR